MSDGVDPAVEMTALRAEVALLEEYLAALRRDHATVLASLAEAERERDMLAREVAESPRQRERADQLREQLDLVLARPGVDAVARLNASLGRLPGARAGARRVAKILARNP